ncbi:MAG TPA: tetratricopeptide repeat protein [Acidimicrobiia bacterium]|nr:tetratricopeptide repeat protein [Acidimicrobiia bacterium]
MGVGQGTGDEKKWLRSKAKRRAGFGGLAVVLAVVLAACSTSSGVDPNVSLSKALADYFAGNVSLANREFKAIVKTDPTNKFAWYDLGVIAQGSSDSSGATTDYLRAIRIDPAFESPLYNLGVVDFQAGKLDDAITYLTRAIASNPHDANAHWNLGLALAGKHIPKDNILATKQLNAALKIDPALLRTLGTPSHSSRQIAPTHGGTGPKGSGGTGTTTKTTVKATTSSKTTTT